MCDTGYYFDPNLWKCLTCTELDSRCTECEWNFQYEMGDCTTCSSGTVDVYENGRGCMPINNCEYPDSDEWICDYCDYSDDYLTNYLYPIGC